MKKSIVFFLVLVLVSIAGASLPNPVGWWKFDGNANDSSGGGNHGTLVGDANIVADAERGPVLGLDGSGDYVTIGDNGSLDVTEFSVSAWFKTTLGGGHKQIIEKRENSKNDYYVNFYLNANDGGNDKISAMMSDGSSASVIRSDDAIASDVWCHVVEVFDGTTHMMYVNGVLQSDTDTSVSSPYIAGTQTTHIGVNRGFGNYNYYFDGKIDDVRIYDKALSPIEVFQLYSGQKAVNPYPADQASWVDLNVILTWSPRPDVTSHDIYFGTSFDDVNSAHTGSPDFMGNQDTNSWSVTNYNPAGLDIDTTYFWRIDEVNGPNIWTGNVWSFETEPLLNAIHIPTDYPSIQSAINAAVNYDTIVVAPGTYYENINFLGKKITVRSTDPNDWDIIKTTIIDGQQLKSTVLFNSNETALSTLDGLTITNGIGEHDFFSGPTTFGSTSGGIYCLNSSPTIRRCYITNNGNSNSLGGGIACLNSSPLIQNCYITDNGYNGRFPMVNYGGGIALLGNCNANITNCLITNNTANVAGSAIIVDSETPNQATSTIRNCTIVNNPIGPIGANFQVGCWDTQTTISNTIIWNCNTGGWWRDLLIKEPSQVTYSCIQQTNLYNNSYGNYGPYGNDPLYDLTTAGGNINDTPHFIQPYGQQQIDYHLLPDSPCINAGDPAFANNSETDIDGQSRIMGGRVDIGADEADAIIIVNQPSASDVWASGSTHNIEWFNNTAYNVDILFSKNAGSTWKTIASDIAAGPYTWNVPDIVDSTQCLISVIPHINDANVICEDSGLFTIHPQNPDVPVNHQWSSLGGSWSRSGLSGNNGPEIGCLKWRFTTGGPVYSGPTVTSDGTVHIACEDGKLYTLDPNGTLFWEYDTNSPLLSSPSIGPDGSVYVGAKDNKLYAFDKNGNLRWTFETEGPVYSSPSVADDGTIYACSQDGLLYAIAPDGSELWAFGTAGPGQLPGSIIASSAIGPDGTIYVGGLYDPNLYALDPNGNVKWNCNFALYGKGKIFSSPVLSADANTIYQVLLNDPNLYAIDANTGDVNWVCNLADGDSGWFDGPYYYESDSSNKYPQYSFGTPGWSEPVLGADGTIYVSFDDPYLRAVDPNGTIKWVKAFGEVGGFTMAVANNGPLYAASDDAYLYVIDPNGNKLAQFQSRNLHRSHYEGDGLIYPVIAADDTLIISDADNALWAISPENCPDTPTILHRPHDINGDGIVSFPDLALMVNEWLDYTAPYFDPPLIYENGFYYLDNDGALVVPSYDKLYPGADIDGDLNVDYNDLSQLVNNWLNKD